MSHIFEKINSGQVYTIAEMSANHGGKLENAIAIVHKAKEIGADCLKIQTYTADTITIDSDKEPFRIHGGLWDGYKLYDLYNDAYTPWDWQSIIKSECDRVGIDFLSTPFDFTAVDFLESIGADAYKIASFELIDIPLIQYTARKGKPMIISCGMGSEEEIKEAIDACVGVGNSQIVLLKCCSEYPANWKDMHLSNIPDMKRKFDVPVGLSDHSLGDIAAVIAVSLGAQIVEKHLCLSKDIANPDVEFSMEPETFGEMIKRIKDTVEIIGKVQYGPSHKENESYNLRRSLFAVKNIKKGDIFTDDNVRSIRPANGLKPKYFNQILGKTAVCDIAFGTPLSFEMIEKL